MKILYWLAAATILIILAAACGSDSSDGGSADVAASFSFEAFGNENFEEGQAISLDTFEGQPIVLNFWYPSCPPCRLEMPHFEAAFQTHQGRGRLRGDPAASASTPRKRARSSSRSSA